MPSEFAHSIQMVFGMNPSFEPYPHRNQTDDLPMGFHFEDNSGSEAQSMQGMVSFDGLPLAQSNHSFVFNTTSSVPSSYSSLTSTIPTMPQPVAGWNNPNQTEMNYDGQTLNGYHGFTAMVTGNEQGSRFVRGMNYSEIPRSWEDYDLRLNEHTTTMETFEPTTFIEDVRDNGMQTQADQPVEDFDVNSNQGYREMSRSQSPKMEDGDPIQEPSGSYHSLEYNVPLNEESDDGERTSREVTIVEVDDHSAEEPYAKLIHRALMSVPNHSMVLQDIYQWFRDNTVKGSADSKGWMNSIRHNLSMNAAFKKTERKLVGDETKKSTEWVLEEFAIRDGVQSTTRYRKSNGARKLIKSENMPSPSRQNSGRKGGITARNIKIQRQRIRDERADPRRSFHRAESMRPHYPHQGRSNMAHRHSSPATPPNHESIPAPSSYFLPKAEPYEVHYEQLYGLEDVQGVFLDAPLFSHQQNGPSFDGLHQYQSGGYHQ
ncbi:hypothetical protein BJ875DRAFT_266855 [Amylocarpus encephaloides]|uniref:Fork-head domain-containing protein n=1 Tax=Amylocarpus encephaloides TaxID=45428 RepID=A0A9P7YKN3_9HELO|nr:hypothetical protein BJ875DRAFT_266855 [Amylocarpus encephaloides]